MIGIVMNTDDSRLLPFSASRRGKISPPTKTYVDEIEEARRIIKDRLVTRLLEGGGNAVVEVGPGGEMR
jgi:hypothetical protein